jgi:hypothetical protein
MGSLDIALRIRNLASRDKVERCCLAMSLYKRELKKVFFRVAAVKPNGLSMQAVEKMKSYRRRLAKEMNKLRENHQKTLRSR